MDYLWTPWRYQYVTTTGDRGECIFCAAARAPDDRAPLVVHRAARSFVILNRFPYTGGHLMVVPYEHTAALEELPDETLVELMRLARHRGACASACVAALDRRHQLHHHGGGDANGPRGVGSHVGEAASGIPRRDALSA
jgi:hypothetical protein